MSRINIENSLYLSNKEFEIVGMIDYGKFGAGTCVEGHPIRYGVEVKDSDGNVYVYGNVCIAKPFILKYWNLSEDQLNDEDVLRAGKYLWIIARDELGDFTKDIPHPKDVNYDFKKLAGILREIVKGARKKKSVHLKELMKVEGHKKKVAKFLTDNSEQHEIVKKLVTCFKKNKQTKILTNWEKSFIISVVTQHNNMRVFSDKQLDVANKILKSKNEDRFQEITRILNKATNIVDKLNEDERQYLFSFQQLFFERGSLTDKQIEVLRSIVTTNYDEFIGRSVKKWLMEKNFSISKNGVIKDVETRTPKAIKAFIEVDGKTFNSWVPISALL